MEKLDDFAQARTHLSRQLRELRISKEVSGKELASRVGISASKLSKIERGLLTPNDRDTARIADYLGVSPDTRGELVRQARELAIEWLGKARRTTSSVTDTNQGYLKDVEAEASEFRAFSLSLVPGLLQHGSYTRCILESIPGMSKTAVDHQVVLRQQRAARHYDNSCTFRYVLCEGVLEFRVGPIEVMRRQLNYLIERLDLPRLHLGIIPTETTIPVPGSTAFAIIDSCVVIDSGTTGGIALHAAEEVADHNKVFEKLAEAAVYGEEARTIIKSHLERLMTIDLRDQAPASV